MILFHNQLDLDANNGKVILNVILCPLLRVDGVNMSDASMKTRYITDIPHLLYPDVT